jgi:hypothetical protein
MPGRFTAVWKMCEKSVTTPDSLGAGPQKHDKDLAKSITTYTTTAGRMSFESPQDFLAHPSWRGDHRMNEEFRVESVDNKSAKGGPRPLLYWIHHSTLLLLSPRASLRLSSAFSRVTDSQTHCTFSLDVCIDANVFFTSVWHFLLILIG